jgi:hypothetical protein
MMWQPWAAYTLTEVASSLKGVLPQARRSASTRKIGIS